MRLLIFGGRFYHDDESFDLWMKRLHGPNNKIKTIINGGAPGADTMAQTWAKVYDIPCLTFHANWQKYGKAAGPLRNQEMIEHGQPTHALAFPGGKGTADMLRRCVTDGSIFVIDAATALYYQPKVYNEYDFRDYLRPIEKEDDSNDQGC